VIHLKPSPEITENTEIFTILAPQRAFASVRTQLRLFAEKPMIGWRKNGRFRFRQQLRKACSMQIDGYDDQRVVNMTDEAKRWLDNITKSFHDSDRAYEFGHPEDGCVEVLCKAIDTAKTLRCFIAGRLARTITKDLKNSAISRSPSAFFRWIIRPTTGPRVGATAARPKLNQDAV
jgi:hypothetical protein